MELQSKELSILLITDSNDLKRTITGLFNDQTLFSISPVKRFLKRSAHLAKVYTFIDYILIHSDYVKDGPGYTNIINEIKSWFPESRIIILFNPSSKGLSKLRDGENKNYYFISTDQVSDQLRTFIKERSVSLSQES